MNKEWKTPTITVLNKNINSAAAPNNAYECYMIGECFSFTDGMGGSCPSMTGFYVTTTRITCFPINGTVGMSNPGLFCSMTPTAMTQGCS